jgi:flavin-dependent dehydrogenase
MSAHAAYDVLVVGGGPGGSTTATFLAKGGLRVALVEREVFPRFHVGESLMPATVLLLEQLGVRETVEASGFQVKYGATFTDQTSAASTTFYFLTGQPWPSYSYEVSRAEFDTILLEHARKHGVEVYQPTRAEAVSFDASGVNLTTTTGAEAATLRGRMLVDASGRGGFLASRIGRRTRIPNLGKVALFAHFRGAARLSGREEGNIRIVVFDDGWFWWIPLAGDITSVGAVLHAKTVRGWDGLPEALYAEMIRRCPEVAAGLVHAEQVTPLHREANFAYTNAPVVGDRFVSVGDAVAFVDPIFSGGVYVAMRSGQLAAEAILDVFADGRFRAARFRDYERRVRRGVAPLFRFIHRYYEPAFFDLFLHPRDNFGIYGAVLNVLSGGSFIRMRWRTRLSLNILFLLTRLHTWARRRAGHPVTSRLEW